MGIGIDGRLLVRLREAHPGDAPLLTVWDDDPDVDDSGGKDDGYDWNVELARTVPWREILIADVDGRPVGVVVLIDAVREESHYWGADVAAGAWAIDIWIGAPGDRNRGIGTQMMRAAVRRCFERHGASTVLIDPLESNADAIRFYERIGFVHLGPRTFGRDRCLVMSIGRDSPHP